jgi:3-deoxy-D-manno-octulosonic-acid transferase
MEVMGNLKLVPNPILPRSSNLRLHTLIRAGGELLVGGSTHPPEEKWIIESFAYLRKIGRTTRLVLAPRNVMRSAPLVDFARSRGFRVQRWSTATELNDSWDILVLDQVGWLTAVYSLRPIVIMGGTFARKGGHNIAEAAAYACPVLVGPEVWNFQEMVDEFHREGGIVKTDRRQLTADIVRLLDNTEERDRIGERARGVLLSHSGCSDSYAASITARLGIEHPGTQLQKDGNRVTALVAQANARSLRRRLASSRIPH